MLKKKPSDAKVVESISDTSRPFGVQYADEKGDTSNIWMTCRSLETRDTLRPAASEEFNRVEHLVGLSGIS